MKNLTEWHQKPENCSIYSFGTGYLKQRIVKTWAKPKLIQKP